MTARSEISSDFSNDANPASSEPLLVRNLAALWAADPKLARLVEAVDAPYPIEATKIGLPTLIRSVAGRDVYLHSRYQPVDEAARFIDTVDVDSDSVFHVHGLALGYHLEELFDRASSEAIYFVYEPDLRMLRTAVEHRDLTRLFQSKRVLIFHKLDKGELFSRLMPYMSVLSIGAGTVSHGPSVRLEPSFHEQMGAWLDEFRSFAKTSLTTLVINGQRTSENIAHNLAWYCAAPGVARLKDKYRGKPAVIVSAGPSLRKNKHLLKGLERSAVMVAVQTTLQPLVEMGVEPHFVTSLDWSDICTRFFEKLPPTIKTELVAEPKATNKIFSMHPGPLSLTGNDFAEGLLREMKLHKDKLSSGATVAHLAYYLAEHLGCDPIIFVGQDLGFSDGLCYTPGTSYEDVWRPELSRFCTGEMKQWEQIARDRNILRRIPDQQGRAMYTEERLFTYLQQFERDFLRSGRTIIDATEGGAQKRGTIVMTLAEAISKHCAEPLPLSIDDHRGFDWSRLGECVESLRVRRAEAEVIRDISEQTLPLLEEIRDHTQDQTRVNRAIAKLDPLRAQMNGVGATYDLVTSFTQSTQLTRFRTDRAIASAKVTGEELQKRQVQRDIDNVKGVAEAAAKFVALMDEVIDSIGSARMKEAA